MLFIWHCFKIGHKTLENMLKFLWNHNTVWVKIKGSLDLSDSFTDLRKLSYHFSESLPLGLLSIGKKKANKFIINTGIKSLFATCTIDTISSSQSVIPLNFTSPFQFTASYWMLKCKACWVNYITLCWTAPLNTTTFPYANKKVIFIVSLLSNTVLSVL